MAKPKQQASKGGFHMEFLTPAQKLAWAAFEKHDVLFFLGPAGVGKTHIAVSFAISEFLAKSKEKIVLARPVVEAGENLGFLPGSAEQKVHPYMMPVYDCLDRLVGREGPLRERVSRSIELSPIAYMRGRAILDTELIPTPEGMCPMGAIKVGDFVFGSDGKPTKVVGVYPQGEKSLFEVGFSDKTKSICSGDHLWNTMALGEEQFTTRTTKQINIKDKHRIPSLSGPVEFKEQQTPINPYILGVLIGNGHLNTASISSTDSEIVDECIKYLPKKGLLHYKGKYNHTIVENSLEEAVKGLNLLGKKPYNIFLPDVYKFNSVECRLAALRGLLDTGGSIRKTKVQFRCSSAQLAFDVMFLVRSLGGFASLRKRDNYVVDIVMPFYNPFLSQKKASKYDNNRSFAKLISYVKPTGEGKCTCIEVEAKDHLYLTNDFIITHNTFHNAVCILDEAQNATKMQLKMFLSRFAGNSKVIVTGDPMQSDLRGDIALVDVVRRLEGVPGIGVIEFGANSIVRHPLVAAILEKLEP